MLKKVFFLLFLTSLFCPSIKAQQPFKEEIPILLRNELYGGLTIHSAGFGLDIVRARHVTGFKKWYWELDAVSMKHPKEVKTINPYFENAKSYIYGKLNYLYMVRPAIGYQKVLYGKGDKAGIEIKYRISFGPSIALAKPIYLDIIYPDTSGYRYDIRTERYDPAKHSIDIILGKASFTHGLGEIKPYIGGFAKFGLSFELGNDQEEIKMIETGISLDAFPMQVPIMALEKNKQLFFNFYISAFLGKRW